jgi:hypothetical protein
MNRDINFKLKQREILSSVSQSEVPQSNTPLHSLPYTQLFLLMFQTMTLAADSSMKVLCDVLLAGNIDRKHVPMDWTEFKKIILNISQTRTGENPVAATSVAPGFKKVFSLKTSCGPQLAFDPISTVETWFSNITLAKHFQQRRPLLLPDER